MQIGVRKCFTVAENLLAMAGIIVATKTPTPSLLASARLLDSFLSSPPSCSHDSCPQIQSPSRVRFQRSIARVLSSPIASPLARTAKSRNNRMVLPIHFCSSFASRSRSSRFRTEGMRTSAAEDAHEPHEVCLGVSYTGRKNL